MSNPSSSPSTSSSVRHITTIEAAIAHCAKHCNHPVLSPGFIPTRLLFIGTDEDPTVRVEITNTADNNHLPEDDGNLPSHHDQDHKQGRPKHKYKYAALSYCWGPPSDALTQCTITSASLSSRLGQVGIQKEELSPILLDAITVTRRLGLSYLWIDSLCILQDDLADWEAESAVMGRIYSNAWVTIVGLGSASCRVGFLDGRWSRSEPFTAGGASSFPESGTCKEITDQRRNQHSEKQAEWHATREEKQGQSHHELPAARRSQIQKSRRATSSTQQVHDQKKEQELDDDNENEQQENIDPPSAWEFASAMSKSRWSTRGWTFQEKALSTRLLYFDRTNIHLRCANFTFREGKQGPLLKKQLAFLEPSDTSMGNTDIVVGGGQADGIGNCQMTEELLESWRNIFIPRFATYEFSRRADNLPAISGLASYVAEVSGYRYAAGLWVEDLGREVVWYGSSGRAKSGSASGKKNNPLSVVSRSGFEQLMDWLGDRDEYIAPSWSWAREGGGMGRLDFLDIPPTTAMTTTTAAAAAAAAQGEMSVVVAKFDVKMELKGLNPYGQITDGELAITSRVLSLLPEEYAKDSSGFEMDWVVHVDCGLPDGLEMVLIGTCDSDVWLGLGLGHVKQRRVYGLVVFPASATPGRYYRVGMFSRPDVSSGWMDFEKARQRTIVII
ncbi:heterokaryon incompatibility protein-domain-containing protein [Rhypophila decipiens]|uniref:Heterokaryon incompatibility protein-domain-containing protein n=1 Tax=Rhypophila decipiens TaxID=261697 RepID=A0AAN7B8B5_9PEZI|nr:heterokaryon incompatibility protein-domain-containing protein [Rhypophila decipiens]